MAKRFEKQKAIELRLQGWSYSQIRKELKVAKSTLSLWLKELPLSDERIRKLKSVANQGRERFRNTMARKKEREFEDVFKEAKRSIGRLSQRELLIAGIFLYWGEGTKAASNSIALSNTDPAVLQFFLKWLRLFSIDQSKLRVVIHLYSDMDIEKELDFWSMQLQLPRSCFRKPYIKKTTLSGHTYTNGFRHGTCNIWYYDKKIWQYVLMVLKYIRQITREEK